MAGERVLTILASIFLAFVHVSSQEHDNDETNVFASATVLRYSNNYPLNGTSVSFFCESPGITMEDISVLMYRSRTSTFSLVCSRDCTSTEPPDCESSGGDKHLVASNGTEMLWPSVTLGDSGNYSCQITTCFGKQLRSDDAPLLVILAPAKPILNVSATHFFENFTTEVQITCSGFVGNPNGTLSLWRNASASELPLTLSYLDSEVNVIGQYKLTTVYQRYDTDSIECRAANLLDPGHEAVSDPFVPVIEYPPSSISVYINDSTVTMATPASASREEEDELAMTADGSTSTDVICTAESNPSPVVRWEQLQGPADAVQLEGLGSLAIARLAASDVTTPLRLRCVVLYNTLLSDGPSSNLTVVLNMTILGATTTTSITTTTGTTGTSATDTSTVNPTRSITTATTTTTTTRAATTTTTSGSSSTSCCAWVETWLVVLGSVLAVSLVALLVVAVFLFLECRRRKTIEARVTKLETEIGKRPKVLPEISDPKVPVNNFDQDYNQSQSHVQFQYNNGGYNGVISEREVVENEDTRAVQIGLQQLAPRNGSVRSTSTDGNDSNHDQQQDYTNAGTVNQPYADYSVDVHAEPPTYSKSRKNVLTF